MRTPRTGLGVHGTAVRLLAVVLGALGVTGLLSVTSPAQAYTYVQNGSPGATYVSKVQGQHVRQCWSGYYYTCRMTPTLYVPATRLDRSPRTAGDQHVRVYTLIEHYRAGLGWETLTSRNHVMLISRGTARTWSHDWTYNLSKVGYFRVTTTVAWYTPAGTWLGGRVVMMNEARDYECVTGYRMHCEAGVGGYLWLREPGT